MRVAPGASVIRGRTLTEFPWLNLYDDTDDVDMAGTTMTMVVVVVMMMKRRRTQAIDGGDRTERRATKRSRCLKDGQKQEAVALMIVPSGAPKLMP